MRDKLIELVSNEKWCVLCRKLDEDCDDCRYCPEDNCRIVSFVDYLIANGVGFVTDNNDGCKEKRMPINKEEAIGRAVLKHYTHLKGEDLSAYIKFLDYMLGDEPELIELYAEVKE